MQIDWFHFTPWTALGGGALIGLSAGLFALLAGRIAGISGILGGLFTLDGWQSAQRWRLMFVLGMALAAGLYLLRFPSPDFALSASPVLSIVAGLLVGVGTRYAQGCTSGHGVCGLSRLSLRSLAAVLSFMGAGFITVFVLRHVLA
ncbi:hypothetical protein SAMN02745857_01563 [Andreprevotia lacus DSM 23236]|jgi:uncharacterized membrane protein YedE/YeeE|uniref:Uncharacterized protein n=1 Tax=Andreprevotia lacus DSM 23236 TaxID=1121001 RepID=A0A1W1XGS2_9NEIS|nr:YeeE/YedE thiosulfate transporter family protein [Andreprevotia lacus]SMC23159.1 hypothetical protein SAMN02745857_01563 [Andreprevotia lacus DSM 23236]